MLYKPLLSLVRKVNGTPRSLLLWLVIVTALVSGPARAWAAFGNPPGPPLRGKVIATYQTAISLYQSLRLTIDRDRGAVAVRGVHRSQMRFSSCAFGRIRRRMRAAFEGPVQDVYSAADRRFHELRLLVRPRETWSLTAWEARDPWQLPLRDASPTQTATLAFLDGLVRHLAAGGKTGRVVCSTNGLRKISG
jgi:hypothetical protein